jgi:hypothetical protein
MELCLQILQGCLNPIDSFGSLGRKPVFDFIPLAAFIEAMVETL